MNKECFGILYIPFICNNNTLKEEDDACNDPLLLTKAQKCIDIAKNFDVEEDDGLIEEIAANLMYCPDEYLDKILKVFI